MEKEDNRLKQALQEGYQKDSPSLSFTPNIMRKIEAKRAEKLKPIIGKWGWAIIAIFFIAIVSAPFLTPSAKLNTGEVTSKVPNLSFIFIIVIMSGMFILFDEFYLRKRKART